ncbi:MAG: M23 family metallopeptidase [Spirochaetia bacterium]
MTLPVFSDFPEITRFSSKDALFSQLQRDISAFYRWSQGNGSIPSPVFFTYVPSGTENILSIAAKLSLPYESIACLNGISSTKEKIEGKRLIIPNIPALFIPESPKTEFELLLYWNRKNSVKSSKSITIPAVQGKKTYFIFPGEKLKSRERAFFLGTFFRKPLSGGRISSSYGTRLNPFTRISSFHRGLDIVVPTGTPVTAAAPGKVIKKGYDHIYGFYVEIFHEPFYQTFYGHLNTTAVVLNQEVLSGTMIGTVGSTGQSTGPHLHFEIRLNGNPVDPERYIGK